MKGITNAYHVQAIQCAQDIVIALVMYACLDINDVERSKQIEKNLKRSKKELDGALKRLFAR